MNTIVIDKKKYVIVEEKEYSRLLKKAASKTPPARKLTLADGKKMAYSIIDKWHSGK
jgi:hypothetical protein